MIEEPNLSIVLPCYNPSEKWDEILIQNIQSIQARFETLALEVILVNDGSDKNMHISKIERIKNEINHFKYLSTDINEGKGNAIRKGVEASQASIIIFTDVDFPYTTDSFSELYKLLDEGQYNIVAGIKSQHYYEQVPFFRRMISKLLQRMIKFFLRLPVADTQCGLKGFDLIGKEVFLETTVKRYLFDLEFLLLASRKKNIKIRFLPVELRPDVTFSSLRVKHLYQEGLNFLKLCFQYIIK